MFYNEYSFKYMFVNIKNINIQQFIGNMRVKKKYRNKACLPIKALKGIVDKLF